MATNEAKEAPPSRSASDAVQDALATAEQGISTISRGLVQGAVSVQAAACQAWTVFLKEVDKGKVYVDEGLAVYRQGEDFVFANLRHVLEFAATNPYIAYPAAGAGLLFTLPVARRLLYRATLGRFRSEEGVFKSCESKVEGLKPKIEDYAKDVQKLEERMRTAEEEVRSGVAKLKATRHELQRLSGTLSKNERVATAALRELRSLSAKAAPNLLEVRGEAASQVASLRSQRSRVNKFVNRILNQDI